jgi:diadenosine tetraphosphate (Ap4A) HIT family hydrolase
MPQPESIEDFHARVAAATNDEGRLPVRVEAMPGWDIFPFELDGLRIKPLEALADADPARVGEDPAECPCQGPVDASREERVAWRNERWTLLTLDMKLPVALILQPNAHHDLADLPDDLASEMGRLMVAVAAAVEALPSVGRCHVGRYGDGGAHLHPFFFGRPARMLQLRGSTLLDWEENLPPVPDDVRRANAGFVAERLVDRVGGQGPAWTST